MGVDVEKARKVAPFLMIVSMALAALSVFVFIDRAWIPLMAILDYQPSLRVTSGAFVAPLAALLFLVLFALALARLLRASAYADKAEVPLVWLCIATLIAVPVVSIGGSLLQHGLLPKYGYHYCNLLSGNPTVWFNDWVKNPEWCVRGKTHEWVREQAAKAQNNSAN